MKGLRHAANRLRNTRPRVDHIVAREQVHAMVADRRNGWKRLPGVWIGFSCALDFDDDVRGPRENELAGGLNALARYVGEHVCATGGFEHVVQKSETAARVDSAQRLAVSAE